MQNKMLGRLSACKWAAGQIPESNNKWMSVNFLRSWIVTISTPIGLIQEHCVFCVNHFGYLVMTRAMIVNAAAWRLFWRTGIQLELTIVISARKTISTCSFRFRSGTYFTHDTTVSPRDFQTMVTNRLVVIDRLCNFCRLPTQTRLLQWRRVDQ